MKLSNIIPELKRFLTLGRLRKEIAYDRSKALIDNWLSGPIESGVSTDKILPCGELIVSLTSYGHRLRTVYLAIASIMNQSLRPNRIVLWLEEGLSGTRLPATIELLRKRGLEVRFCKDIRSYKKLIPALEAFPDDTIVTIDDDMIYDFDMIDRLVSAHLSEPTDICVSMSREISPGKTYEKWPYVDHAGTSIKFIVMGGSGCLFPPHCFTPEICDTDKFMSLAPTADDLWYTAQAIKAGTRVRKVRTLRPDGMDFTPILDLDWREGLVKENIAAGGNDRTMDALKDYFIRVFDI